MTSYMAQSNFRLWGARHDRALHTCRAAFLCRLLMGFILITSPAWGQSSSQACSDGILIFSRDFESGDLSGFTDNPKRLKKTLKKIRVVTKPVRHGRYAAEFTLYRKDQDDVNYRTDLVTSNASGDYLRLHIGRKYWYGFSTLFPRNWVPDTQSELFAQWHASPDEGEDKRSPNLAIYVYGEDYCIKKRWDANKISDKESIPSKILWCGKIEPDKGIWIDWVFHVKWSFHEDGFVDVWKDGNRILSDKGPNSYNDKQGPYFRFGPYKWPWKKDEEEAPSTVSKRIVYFDEIRIGDENACYELVRPPQ